MAATLFFLLSIRAALFLDTTSVVINISSGSDNRVFNTDVYQI